MSDLINSVSLPRNENRNIRTIHQAKGTQFDNVLVSLNHLDSDKASKQLSLLFDDSSDEEKRILYVAMSRAKKRLFISTPQMEEEQIQKAKEMGLEIK